jgi:GAF domain-containing protein
MMGGRIMSTHKKKTTTGGSKNIFQPIAESIHHTTGLPVSIWTPDKKGKTLKIVASVGLPEEYIKTASLDLAKPSVTGDAFSKKRIQIAKDINSDPRWYYKEQARKMNWKSAICIPIEADDIAIGVISVYAFVERSIPDLRHILPDFAKQIGLSIEAGKQTEIRERILDIGLKLQTVGENPKDVLREIVNAACELTGASSAVVYPYDNERGEFLETEDIAAYGLKKPLTAPERPRTEGGMAADVMRKGEVIIENLGQRGPSNYARSSFIRKEGIQAFIGIALKETKNVLGVLYVNFSTSHFFTRQEKDTIRLFAQQASTALKNSRYLQQAKSQIAALERLHEVGTTLTTVTGAPESLKAILVRIAQGAQAVLGADLIDLYQYVQDRDWYDLPPIQIGRRNEPSVVKTNILADDVIHKVVEKKHPQYVTNSKQNKDFISDFIIKRPHTPKARFVIREEIASTASIPLMVGSEVVGVLFANYRTQQVFSQPQRELIELFANQAAIAIRNNRLYDSLQRNNQELRKLQHLMRKLTVETDLDKLLQELLQSIHDILGFEYATVSLVNRAQYNIETLHGIWQGRIDTFPGWISKSRYTLDHGDILPDIVRKGKAEIISSWDNRFNKEIWDEYDHDQLARIFMPIKIKDEVIGVVEAGHDKSRQVVISHEEQQSLQAFVDQAALAIQNARQFGKIEKNLEERLRDIHALRDITEQMHQGELGTVLDLIAERAVELTGAKHGGVWLVNKMRTALEFRGLANKEQYEELPPNIPLDRDSENSFSKKVVLSGLSYLSSDVHKDPNYKPWYEDTCSELTVPITYRDKVIGTVNVESPRENSFTEDHKRLLEAMADQAAVVVQNARLLERINVLDDIGIELTSGRQLKEEQILESIYSQVIHLTGAQDMYIALYDDLSGEIRFPIATKKGERVQYPTRQANMEKRGKTEEIIFTRKPILHKTKKEAEEWYAQPGHEEFVGLISSSWLGVPIMVGERVLGVIVINELEQEYAYDEQDLQVFSSMASQAAFALVNQELNRRNSALASLNEVGKTLTSGIRKKEEEVLDLIFAEAQELTGAKDLYIALYHEDTAEVRFVRATEKGKPVSYPSRKANMEKRGKTEEIIFTRKPILHKTMREAKEWYLQFGHKEFIGHIQPSWLGVPMMVGERVLGVIAAVDLDKEYAYDELHLEVLSSMASQAAIALDNATLYYEVNQKLEGSNQQLETILNIINAVELHADLHEFLQEILEDLLARIHVKSGTIQLYDPKRNELVIWAKVGSVINPKYQHIPLEIGLTGKVAREKRSIYITDVKIVPEYVNYISDTRSEFACPMLIGNVLIGVLNAEDPQPDAFSSYTRQLLGLLGNQLAILIRQKLIAQELEEKRLVSQVNESLGLVTAEVAHKVGNAAGKIRFLTRERLQGEPNITESQKKDIQIILRNVEDMIKATDDLFKPFGMEPQVDITIEEMIRVAIGQCALPKNIKISTNFQSDLPKVNVQVTKVQSYLAELLTNAIKYTIKGMAHKNIRSEKVEIMGQRGNDGFVEIHFTNHGPAIPPDQWESIFRVFSARGQKSDDDQSYGLGLWGTRATMQQQGGDVFLLESDDVKTTFVVRFPPA